MPKKKSAFQKMMPEPFELEIGGETYSLGRLTNKALFRFVSILSKIMTLADWTEILDKIDAEADKVDTEIISKVMMGITAGMPLFEQDFNAFIQAVLVDDEGKHPSLKDIEELPADVLLNIIERLAEQEDFGGLLLRFFAVTPKLLQSKTAGQ